MPFYFKIFSNAIYDARFLFLPTNIQSSDDSSSKLGNCGNWRYRQYPNDAIQFSNWDRNEGCEGDTCARMQGNGNISISFISKFYYFLKYITKILYEHSSKEMIYFRNLARYCVHQSKSALYSMPNSKHSQ